MIRIGKSKAAETLGSIATAWLPLILQTQIESMALGSMSDKNYNRYKDKKYKALNEMKGGMNIMETKSRYEVIADLEEKKRDLILSRDSLADELKGKKKGLRNMKRDIEDKEEEIKDFEESMKDREETTNELIKSVDESLNRFAELSKKKS